MTLALIGIHHVTAVTARARENLAFYTGTLGMRLVKKTVNQDDVSAYHLFYADGKGSPGTDLTFFDWDYAAPRQPGSNSISRVGLQVAGSNGLEWWASHLETAGVRLQGVAKIDGREIIDFEDPEGQRLSLVATPGIEPRFTWPESSVPIDHQIAGLGPVTITVTDLAPTAKTLVEVMNMRSARQYADPDDGRFQIHVFQMAGEGPGAELHVRVRPDLRRERAGAGGVHHIAFRVPDEDQYHAWTERLRELRVPNSGEVDRFYFRSLYFREPNGILFELATDGPGFATDETEDRLGTRLALPPFLEARRAQIEAGLKPLTGKAN
jgi:glyoxalase family protein